MLHRISQFVTIILLLSFAVIFTLVSASPLESGFDGQEFHFSSPYVGYAIIENLDAGLYADDNGQAVYMIAPEQILLVQNHVAVMNNVLTNTNYFLQNGLGFSTNYILSSIIWSSTSQNYVAQVYPITYFNLHTYEFVIASSCVGCTPWQLCTEDIAIPSTWNCVPDISSTGQSIIQDLNTSVFAEVGSTLPNWYTSINKEFRIYGATIIRNGIHQNWTSNHRHTSHACSNSYPAIFDPITRIGAIKGTLVNGALAKFHKKGLPLFC